MQEIKAYVRRACINQVVHALREMGAPGIDIMEVHPVGYGYEPKYFAPPFGEMLQPSSQTGAKGDGIILCGACCRAAGE